jgi:hypothetical protein
MLSGGHSLRQIHEKFIFPKALMPLGNPGVRTLVRQGPPDPLQTDRSWITLHQHVIGGGHGRYGGPQDVVLDAVRLAQVVGRPVKVIWSREEEIATDDRRPRFDRGD